MLVRTTGIQFTENCLYFTIFFGIKIVGDRGKNCESEGCFSKDSFCFKDLYCIRHPLFPPSENSPADFEMATV